MMRDEEITYATVRFHKSSGLQSPSRPDETQGPKDSRTFAGGKGCSCPWKPVVIPLGVLCSLLLVTVIVLLTHIFQYHQEKHKLQETLRNLHYNYSNVQNDCNLKEEKLRNKSRECDDLKDELDSLKREWNRCYGNTKTVLDFSQYRGKCAEGRWFCCGLKCYYITMESKHWIGCKQTCKDCSLSLLKIDDDSEMRFLQLQLSSKSYWIGLSYDSSTKKWAWIDNGPSKLALNNPSYHRKIGGCVFLSKTRLEVEQCGRSYPCICEKRLDKFHDSLSKNT
ncbi:T-cell surface glycoprotein YE1/48-like [Meriones unguiculatus]|uniref:T-cell surface glycoprotein YE1/48-like n=1 Tax=Meriones unguiculatus TaxID=10047 RepID=UPI00293E483D|nr:T-cell surface glycoprotein YE1/48-like [Meriones unguiculatus]XP_060240281.1 T-cell surface glycoprotein YE1/48-like [Meriones unguiculatus]